MKVTIYQPRYFPQLHYFNRMIDADVFVFLDNAQYTKSLRQKTSEGERRVTSFQSDTPIKLPHGKFLLTVPILHNGYSQLNETRLDYLKQWSAKHLAVIKASYQKAPYFEEVHETLKSLLSVSYLTLAGLNIMTTLWALSYLYDFSLDLSALNLTNINAKLEKQQTVRLKKILFGSTLGIQRPEGLQKGTEWTTAICLKLGATEYFHGGTARDNYMNLDYYKARGVTPVVQQWACKEYPQQFGKKVSFIPNLSIIDLLCNVSKKQAQRIIASDTSYGSV